MRKEIVATLSVGLTLAALLLASNDRLGRLLIETGQPALAARTMSDPVRRGAAHYEAGAYDAAVYDWKRSGDVDAPYNLGNAFARSGKLQLAVKAYDLALRRNPHDEDAIANRKLVLALAMHADAKGQPSGIANVAASRESSTRSSSDKGGDDTSSEGDGLAGDRQASSDAARGGRNKIERRGQASARTLEQGQSSSSGSASDTTGRAGKGSGMTNRAESDMSKPDQVQSSQQELAEATSQWFAAIPDDPLHFVRLRIQAEHGRRLAAGIALQPGGGQW